MRRRPCQLLLAWLLASLSLHTFAGQALMFRRPQQHQQHRPQADYSNNQTRRRPDSSSSFFADIEDLNDSSIRTRPVHQHQQPQPPQQSQQPQTHQSSRQNQQQTTPMLTPIGGLHGPDLRPGAPADFDTLIEAILEPIKQQQGHLKQSNGGGHHPIVSSTVAADANNRTTMRFFRNNKTFASIVHTNQVPRRLINCHLVDLERHASDVALFEAKYQMGTFDVGFRDMMQLIDACTNIARQRVPAASALKTQQQVVSAQSTNSNKQSVAGGGSRFRRQQQQHPVPASIRPTAGALITALSSQPQDESLTKKLVLGEVTPPPETSAKNNQGIREALQEISSYDSSDLLSIWRGILPGTNWCGMGDRATSYNDLGFEADIDICCRAHDFCPIRLSAFTSGYGLFNWSFYTRSHCWCDQNFLDCLQRASSPLSAVVTRFYFNVMKTTCLHDNETLSEAPAHLAQVVPAHSVAQLAPAPNTHHKRPSSHSSSHSSRPLATPAVVGQKATPSLSSISADAAATTKQEQLPAWRRPMQQHQHRFLLDQIRASLPIPALKQSTSIGAHYNERRQARPPGSSIMAATT